MNKLERIRQDIEDIRDIDLYVDTQNNDFTKRPLNAVLDDYDAALNNLLKLVKSFQEDEEVFKYKHLGELVEKFGMYFLPVEYKDISLLSNAIREYQRQIYSAQYSNSDNIDDNNSYHKDKRGKDSYSILEDFSHHLFLQSKQRGKILLEKFNDMIDNYYHYLAEQKRYHNTEAYGIVKMQEMLSIKQLSFSFYAPNDNHSELTIHISEKDKDGKSQYKKSYQLEKWKEDRFCIDGFVMRVYEYLQYRLGCQHYSEVQKKEWLKAQKKKATKKPVKKTLTKKEVK